MLDKNAAEHNSQNIYYRSPVGAAEAGSSVRLGIRLKTRQQINQVLLRIWHDKAGEKLIPLKTTEVDETDIRFYSAEIEMPDFYRGDDWWRNGQNLYLDNLEATGLYQVPLSAAQPGDVLLCCFGSSVPNHAAIYCGDGELLHHIPEQLSKRERYTDKWQRRTHSLWRHRAWHASAFTGIYNDLAAASTFV